MSKYFQPQRICVSHYSLIRSFTHSQLFILINEFGEVEEGIQR